MNVEARESPTKAVAGLEHRHRHAVAHQVGGGVRPTGPAPATKTRSSIGIDERSHPQQRFIGGPQSLMLANIRPTAGKMLREML